MNIPLGIACIWITRAHVRESRDPRARRVDVPGQVALGSGLFLLVLALLRGNEEGWSSTFIVAALAGGAVLLAAFLVIESRVKEPMLPLGMFRNPSFAGAQVAALAISATFFAIFLYVTLYLQQVLGLSAIEAGLVYLPRDDRDVRRVGRDERGRRPGLRPRDGRRRARASSRSAWAS